MPVLQKTSAGARRRLSDERGMALLVALMAILLVMALGTALALWASVESTITRNFLNSSGALYAADAGLERAVGDLKAITDWNAVLSGAASSAFADGAPAGTRALSDGRLVNLAEIVSLANCRQVSPCTSAAMDASTADRPWGSNNPRWQPFAWGPLSGLLPPEDVEPPFYVVVMVGDDPSENDGDPFVDGAAPCPPAETGACNPGTDRLAVRAEAFGPFGAHAILELTVGRRGAGERSQDDPDYNIDGDQADLRILSWRELR
jgi:hypothetical protein